MRGRLLLAGWASVCAGALPSGSPSARAARRTGSRLLSASAVAPGAEPAFDALTFPGYTLEPDAKTGVGGWLAHRRQLEMPGSGPGDQWVLDILPELARARGLGAGAFGGGAHPPRILVLYGSLREPRAFSKLLAFEFARLLEALGCDVRTFDPHGLPVRDPSLEGHGKVAELRALSEWSEGHVWVSPELHGALSGAFKNQIDWLPLNSGSVRPTQGRTVCLAQVNGGSQSFNVVNALRLLARWMRMPCCTNQSSVPKAWLEFDDDGRMRDSPLRDRVVDVAEECARAVARAQPANAACAGSRCAHRRARAAFAAFAWAPGRARFATARLGARHHRRVAQVLQVHAAAPPADRAAQRPLLGAQGARARGAAPHAG